MLPVMLLLVLFFALALFATPWPFALTSATAGPALPGLGGSLGESLGGAPAAGGDAIAALKSIRDLLKNLIVLLGALSDYLEGQIIAHVFRTASFTKPTVLAVALYTATPGETGGGTEVSGGSYARVSINPLDANWAAPVSGNGTTSNVAAATFPAPTANWGTITSTAVLDATSAGNFMVYGALTTSKTVNNGDAAPSFAIGALSVALD